MLLFLPLAHNFARLVQFLNPAVGFTLAYCADVREVSAALMEVKPTLFPSVPRVYEKVYAAVKSAAAESGGVKGRLAEWAFAVGQRKVKGGDGALLGLQARLADKLVLGKVRARMGGRMRYAVSGGAPLAPEIAEFFQACGLTILEGYGMTECTTAATMNRPGGNRIRTVGPALPGIELRIEEDGEILIRGDNVFGGYYRNPEATAETLTEDGWLRSGDIGVIDEDGYLSITDRKKDILVTSGGKNVSPQVIENALKASPYISQVLVVGDNRPYVAALITVDGDEVKAARRSGFRRGARGDRTGGRGRERGPRPRRADQDASRSCRATSRPTRARSRRPSSSSAGSASSTSATSSRASTPGAKADHEKRRCGP